MKNSHSSDALLTGRFCSFRGFFFWLPALLRRGIGGVTASAWKTCGGVFSETAAPLWCQRVCADVFLGDITNYRSTPPFRRRLGGGGVEPDLIKANAAYLSLLNVFLNWKYSGEIWTDGGRNKQQTNRRAVFTKTDGTGTLERIKDRK